PDGTSRTYSGSLQETPVFLGCSDVDPHIPLARVHESSQSLSNPGAAVEERIYPGMGHTINEDEIKYVHSLLTQVSARLAGAEQIDPPVRQFKRWIRERPHAGREKRKRSGMANFLNRRRTTPAPTTRLRYIAAACVYATGARPRSPTSSGMATRGTRATCPAASDWISE